VRVGSVSGCDVGVVFEVFDDLKDVGAAEEGGVLAGLGLGLW
jgi:hypothetical protein